MVKELTRTGIVGLELTREELADVRGCLSSLIRKAQCRAVNCDVIDLLGVAANTLEKVDIELTGIIGD